MPTPSRSLKLSPDGKRLVERALTDKAWSTDDLAEEIGVGRATATTFRAGKKGVDRQNFVKFCQALGLDWEKVAEANQPSSPNPVISFVNSQIGLGSTRLVDELIDVDEQAIRQHCQEHILENYSEMRLLSGEKIKVDQLYVDVWLLNRSPRTFRTSQNKMLETFDLRTDRLGLGDRIKRNPGFDVANADNKLLILGKPGAGKTTFLKHLAVDWCNGKFQPKLITVFIELRQIQNNQWNFLDAIRKELNLQALKPVEALLKAGGLMVLMDGFDEVATGDLRRNVQRQLGKIAKEYPKNRFIMTCRTQVMTTIPNGFASVEVADFSGQQVEVFVKKWFQANGQNERAVAAQWATFQSATAQNAALKELCVTPVLLGLMCLVLQDEGKIPAQISSLYDRGIKLLLQKWNDKKDIPGWEMGTAAYRNLEVEQKEHLLIQIAAKKFENPENFVLFDEDDLVQQIVGLLDLSSKAEGEATLKAIEAQHGLLIERADGLWSFSHLTFQEYFTTQWLLSLSPEELTQKITNKQWQNVVQQLVRSQGHSDRLLRLIKQALDQMLSQDPNLQAFLIWLDNKARSIQGTYRQSAVRALYFHLALALDLARARDLDRDLDLALARDLARALDLALARALDRDLTRDLDLDLDFPLARALARALDLDLDLDLDRDLAFALDRDRAFALDLDRALTRARARDLDFNVTFTDKFKELSEKIPSKGYRTDFILWWQSHGTAWVAEFRQAIIEHRNLGHNWHFTAEQQQQLQRYGDTNKFLVELLKIDKAATPKVRQEIEDNLLLPTAELKRRLPEQYGT